MFPFIDALLAALRCNLVDSIIIDVVLGLLLVVYSITSTDFIIFDFGIFLLIVKMS